MTNSQPIRPVEEEVRCICSKCYGEGWCYVTADRAKELKRLGLMEDNCPYGDDCEGDEDEDEDFLEDEDADEPYYCNDCDGEFKELFNRRCFKCFLEFLKQNPDFKLKFA